MRVAFAGSPPVAVTVLERLIAHGHEIAVAITQPDRPRGRGRAPEPTPLGRAAVEHGIDLWRPATINAPDVLEALRELDVGVLCVVGFGQLLKADVLDGWTCINVHFSLLPAYRGAAPVERAIMDGLTQTGVTIMQMDAGLDTGPIIATHAIAMGDDDDAGAVLHTLAVAGGEILSDVLTGLESQPLTLRDQPQEGVSLAPRLTDADRVLDLTLAPRTVVDRIRALSPHIGARLAIDDQPFKLWRARVADDIAPRHPDRGWVDDGRLYLPVADGVIEVLEIQPPSRSRMAAADFVRGWRGDLAVA